MFPKCYSVTARRDFDNESARRRGMVAILDSQLWAEARIRLAGGLLAESSESLPAKSDLLDAAFSGFHSLILVEASASSALLACKIGGTTLASNSSSRRIQPMKKFINHPENVV